jgi:alkanesulfonate monooxygenase SsuD/methylene tetrahydromethanopterin reductase-like flavin-dependent oxidoreductase (luciferase family)
MNEAQGFHESLEEMTTAEALGFHAVWLAEIHFQKGRSLLASPLVVATAIAQRTRRVKIGIAVQVLPLSHPLRLAEDVATVDHLSKGRLDLGVGRSGLPDHYRGLCIIPKPFQKPHPPLRVAATTHETYALVGRMGLPIFLAVRSTSVSDLKRSIGSYHAGWREAGHSGRGQVTLIVPVYVADTEARARAEPEASTMHFFRTIADQLARGGVEREADAARLGRLTYDEVQQELVVYGTAEAVAARLQELREDLGYSALSVWMNVGGLIPHERVLGSMRRFAERVIPRLS